MVASVPSPVAAYQSEATPLPSDDTDGARVVALLQQQAETAQTPVAADGRLAQLSAVIAREIVAQGETPSADVIQFFARQLGIAEPVPAIASFDYADLASIEGELPARLGPFLSTAPFTHVGAATVSKADGVRLAVMVASERHLTLSPVPRSVEPGPLAFEGELLHGYHNPEFALTTPSGQTQRIPAGGGSGVHVRLPLTQSGAYGVELLARGETGITVVANVVIYVGEAPPLEFAIYEEAAPTARNADDVRAALIRLVGEERERAGVSPLTHDEGLARVAQAHCDDMVANGYVGHESPTTGTPGDRLRAAGYGSGLMLENVGRAYSAEELHRGLMDSPGHRANILDGRVTHLGVAVVAIEEGERTAYIATQVFTQMTGEIDTSAAPARLLALINEGRVARRANAAQADELLSRAAQDAADAYFADPEMTQEDATDQAGAALRRFAIAYRRVGALMTVVTTLEDAARLEPVFDPDVTTLGIGVAQGSRPDSPPNSIAVVIVLGWPR